MSDDTPAAASDPLDAAHDVFTLLAHVRFVMLDAEHRAKDGRLLFIARWIRERIDSLDDELLKEVTATVKALEKRDAEAKAAGRKPAQTLHMEAQPS